MNLGCRTAVIFSPWDMSCGWDEHTHEHGSAPAARRRHPPGHQPRQLRRRPAAGGRGAGGDARDQPTRRTAPRQQFVLAQLRHQGDWNPDPNSTVQLLRHVASESSAWRSPSTCKCVDAEGDEAGHVPVPVHDRLPRPAAERRRGRRPAPPPAGGRLPVHQQLLRLQRLRPARPRAGRQAVPRPEAGAGAGGPSAVQVVLHDQRRQGPPERRAAADRAGGHRASRTGWCWSTRRTTWSRT